MNSIYRSDIASRFGLTLHTSYFCRCFILPFFIWLVSAHD